MQIERAAPDGHGLLEEAARSGITLHLDVAFLVGREIARRDELWRTPSCAKAATSRSSGVAPHRREGLGGGDSGGLWALRLDSFGRRPGQGDGLQ